MNVGPFYDILPPGAAQWRATRSPGRVPCKEMGFGLYDYNARYYSAYLNRFISPDSIVPNPANPQSLNRYSYGYNNPVKFVDRDGHFPIPIVLVPLAKILLEGGGILLGTWAIQQEPVQEAIDSTAQDIREGGRKAVDFVEETLINGSVEAYPLGELPNSYGYQQPTLTMPEWEPVLPGASLSEPVTFGLPLPDMSEMPDMSILQSKVVQSGEKTIRSETAKALNKHYGMDLHPRDWGRALEALKRDFDLPAKHHGKIYDDGTYADKDGNEIGNLFDYLP